MYICSIVKQPTTCQECGKSLRKYAVLSNDRKVGLDCAATLIGKPVIGELEKAIAYIQNAFIAGNSTTKYIAIKTQNLVKYSVKFTSATISLYARETLLVTITKEG